MITKFFWVLFMAHFLLSTPIAHGDSSPGELCASELAIIQVNPAYEREKLFDVLMNDYYYFLREDVVREFCALLSPGASRGITFKNSPEAKRLRIVKALIAKTSPFNKMNDTTTARILRRGETGVQFVEESFPAVETKRKAKELNALAAANFQSVVYEFLLEHEDFLWKANEVEKESGAVRMVGGFSGLGAFGLSLPFYFMGHIHAAILAPIVIAIPIIASSVKNFVYRQRTAKPLRTTLDGFESASQDPARLGTSSDSVVEELKSFPIKKLVEIEVVEKLVPLFSLERPTTLLDFGGDLGREIFNFTHAFNSRLFKKGSTAPYLALREALSNTLKLSGSSRTISAISDRVSLPLQGLQKLAQAEAEENLEFQEVYTLLNAQIESYASYLEAGKGDPLATSNSSVSALLEEREAAIQEYGKTLKMAGENLQSEKFQIVVLRQVSEKMMQFLMRRLSDASSNAATTKDFETLKEFLNMLEGV